MSNMQILTKGFKLDNSFKGKKYHIIVFILIYFLLQAIWGFSLKILGLLKCPKRSIKKEVNLLLSRGEICVATCIPPAEGAYLGNYLVPKMQFQLRKLLVLSQAKSQNIWQTLESIDGIQEAIWIYFNTFHKYFFLNLGLGF